MQTSSSDKLVSVHNNQLGKLTAKQIARTERWTIVHKHTIHRTVW